MKRLLIGVALAGGAALALRRLAPHCRSRCTHGCCSAGCPGHRQETESA